MSSHPTPPRAAGLARTHWTPAKQRLFLDALLDCGSVAQAARRAGMSRSSAHQLRARLPDTPFDRTWARALRLHARDLADPFGAEASPSGRAGDAEEARR